MANDSELLVAVIVVTWNSADVIEALLRSIRASTFCGQRQIVVVDNASADNTVELVERTTAEAVVVQTGRNAGYAAAINLGMARAGHVDAYLIVNPDVRFEPQSMQVLMDAMQERDLGIAVPRLVDQDGGLRFSLRRTPSVARAWGEAILGGTLAGRIVLLGEVERRPAEYRLPRGADWATGAAMLVSRACAQTVGSWDETYFLYSEETDYALRAKDAGFRLELVPKAEMMHAEGESHQSPSLFSLLEQNRVKFYRSRHGRVASAFFWAGVLVGDLIRSFDPARRAAVSALVRRRAGHDRQ